MITLAFQNAGAASDSCHTCRRLHLNGGPIEKKRGSAKEGVLSVRSCTRAAVLALRVRARWALRWCRRALGTRGNAGEASELIAEESGKS